MNTTKTPTWIPRDGNYKPQPIYPFVVEQCARFSIPRLLKGISQEQQQISLGPFIATVCLDDGYLQLGQHRFELYRVRQKFGGCFWLIRCPLTKQLRWHLYIDPRGNIGSRDSLRLTYAERRLTPRKRRIWHRVQLWSELHGEKATPDLRWFETHPDVIPPRPKRWVDGKRRFHERRMYQPTYNRKLRKLTRKRRPR